MNRISISLLQSVRALRYLFLLIPAAVAVTLLVYAAPAQACGPYCDMMGGDKSAHYLDNAAACESACDRTGDCRGWTWVKPGIQGPRAVCYLKNRLMPAKRSDCCISGYRGDRSAANSMRQFRFDVGQKEALPPPRPAAPPVQGGGQPQKSCACVNSRGQRYKAHEDLLGQYSCNLGDRWVCQ